jgi:hypothetical protein
MLSEPLLALLPADESEILSSVPPRVNPDAVLRKIRRLQIAGVVVRDRRGKLAPLVRPTDDDAPKGNPKPRSRLKGRVCRTCGELKMGTVEHFKRAGRLHSTCNDCHLAELKARRDARINR